MSFWPKNFPILYTGPTAPRIGPIFPRICPICSPLPFCVFFFLLFFFFFFFFHIFRYAPGIMVEDPRNGTMDERHMIPPFCLFLFLSRVIFFSVVENITQTFCCFFLLFIPSIPLSFWTFFLRFTPVNLPKTKSLAFLFP